MSADWVLVEEPDFFIVFKSGSFLSARRHICGSPFQNRASRRRDTDLKIVTSKTFFLGLRSAVLGGRT